MAEPIAKDTIAFEGASKKQRIVVDNTASALTKAIDPESQVGILFLFAVVTSKSDRGGGGGRAAVDVSAVDVAAVQDEDEASEAAQVLQQVDDLELLCDLL